MTIVKLQDDYNGKINRLVNKLNFNTMLKALKNRIFWLYYFNQFVWKQFFQRRGFQNASSLAYTTLLSIVPLVAVMFSFFGNLTLFKEINETVQEFIFGNFVPAFGQTVREYLISYSVKASQLTITGTAALIIIALMMIATIDSALNHIWNVLGKRKALSRFLTYWAILTVGPIMLGIGLYSTSYLLALPAISSADSTLMIKSRLLTFMPFLTTTIAFSLLYILVPNCYVNRRNAIIGALIAALLFELAKYSFGIYVKAVPTYETIYGAIAAIPIFLVWIYLSWIIVLLGAHIAYCLSIFQIDDTGEKRVRYKWGFIDAYKIIAQLWEAQKEGKQITSIQIRRRVTRIPHLMVNQILELMQKADWVHRTVSGKWMLTRDVNELSLNDLYHLLPSKFPEKIDTQDKYSQSLQSVIQTLNKDMTKLLDVSLGEIFRSADKN